MPDELEQRLRSSLRAYADLVDEPDEDELPAPRTEIPRARSGRWREGVLAAAAAAAVVTWTFWVVTDDDTGVETATGTALSSTEGSAELPTGDAAAAAGAPEGPVPSSTDSVAPGVASPLDLYTHCGVLGTDVGGVWFAADPPLVDGAGNPPPGWGNPYQPGTLTLVTADEAVFADDAGHVVRLRAADESARPAPCD
ncbi:hypothetical protein [Blastococcus sp. CT_GayMR16]|uniref:hypothetical protein n=1 Tax=Blastococcus sp. CT_GayMR16 TaxID=2559607 RepID=UPI0010735CF1|nr:hypothetical protein [Blastococcus sp. CT_GayMR16]TFV86014.1 hypothetical protein E4P38_18590 [Blastococcus sp. CT_GayMR16]